MFLWIYDYVFFFFFCLYLFDKLLWKNATCEILKRLVSCRALNSSGFANLLSTCGMNHRHLKKLVLTAV